MDDTVDDQLNGKHKNILVFILLLGFSVRLIFYFLYEFHPVDVVRYRQVSFALFDTNTSFIYPELFGYPIFLKITSIFTNYDLQKIRIVTIILGTLNIYLIGLVARSIIEYYDLDNLPKNEIIHITRFLWATSWISIFVDTTGYTESLVITMLMLVFLLLYNSYTDYDSYLLVLVYFCLAMTRQEYQIFSPFIACIFYMEGYQFDDINLKKKSKLVFITGLLTFVLWSVISNIVYGNISAVSDLRIRNTINRNSPNVEPHGLMWYIFEYHGFIDFITISLIGFITLFALLTFYLVLPNFILLIFGSKIFMERRRYSLILFYFLGSAIHSFNAFEWEFIDAQRMIQPYIWPLFIVISVGLSQLKGFELNITSENSIVIKRSTVIIVFFIIFLLLFYVVYLLLSMYFWWM